MRLLITPSAVQDIEDIGFYIAQDNARRALSFIGELRQQFRIIASTPLAYRSRKELGENLRSSGYGRYVIFFECSDELVTIVRVLHEARDLGAQLSPQVGPAPMH
ncbi:MULTISPECIES: type II toxin-antitoxin system RelE/ParE family toxin [unclassified Pseudomonas]|uniref:type II toxin-antitoxin system RelE/ParE family toxin n=1 Tax=unclassified Pseudomonas TaxID=196821 RepID=UPI0015A2D330|nr:type II toxin-antitoxin system RelE/ParE family toxin [Pseudomonas sp. IPO3779]NWD15329.1 type II toxin-antitoxin system RelE/ParE family toxin [Pseudomonas sp. IPO3778]